MTHLIRVKFIYLPTDLNTVMEIPADVKYTNTKDMVRDIKKQINKNTFFHAFQIGVENRDKINWLPGEYYIGKMASIKDTKEFNNKYEMGFSHYIKTPDSIMIPYKPGMMVVNQKLQRVFPKNR